MSRTPTVYEQEERGSKLLYVVTGKKYTDGWANGIWISILLCTWEPVGAWAYEYTGVYKRAYTSLYASAHAGWYTGVVQV